MRKTDKKIDNAIRAALTEACDEALEKHAGFLWLTHFVNYQDFPDSLSIVCIFDTNKQLSKANLNELRAIIKAKLTSIEIKVNSIHQHVIFDTEENCEKENNGNWKERFKQFALNNKNT